MVVTGINFCRLQIFHLCGNKRDFLDCKSQINDFFQSGKQLSYY